MSAARPALHTGEATLRLLALLLLGADLVVGLALTLPRAVSRARQAVVWRAVDAEQVRAMAHGEAWVAAIDRIRAAVPRDGEYALIDAGEPALGAALWARFDLAPRQARFLGHWSRRSDGADLASRLPPQIEHVVVAFPEPQPPLLLHRDQLLRSVATPHGDR